MHVAKVQGATTPMLNLLSIAAQRIKNTIAKMLQTTQADKLWIRCRLISDHPVCLFKAPQDFGMVL